MKSDDDKMAAKATRPSTHFVTEKEKGAVVIVSEDTTASSETAAKDIAKTLADRKKYIFKYHFISYSKRSLNF